jgi:hypothetical protein
VHPEAIFQGIQAIAVVTGIGFAAYEIRQYRHDRNREAAMELLHAFQTPDFAKAVVLVYRLPDGLSKREVESRLGDDLYVVYAMTTTWESIGVLLHRGEISMDLVDDFFSGPIVVSWRKLKNYVAEERQETGRATVSEWFQWLAERFIDWETEAPPIPANVQFRDWRAR